METSTFLLWSSASASQEKRDESSICLPHQAKPMPMAADLEPKNPQIQKPKYKKSGGKSSAAAQKRQPQRGLGVAQLERLRLQERWKKITEFEPADHQIQPPKPYPQYHQYDQQLGQYPFQLHVPVYDNHQSGAGVFVARYAAAAPAGYAGAWGESCFLQRHRLGNPGGYLGPGGAVSTARNVFPDQYTVDRFRIAAASDKRLQVGNPLPELSSNQKLQYCFFDCCEFCINKKKRILGEKLWNTENNGRSGEEMDGTDFLGVDHSRAVVAAEEMVDAVGEGRKGKEREVNEYEFFPCSGSGSTGDPAFGKWKAGDASSTSSSSAPPSFLDLSLKLSSYY